MGACDSTDCGCSAAPTTLTDGKLAGSAAATVVYRIENMDCPTEEAMIRQKLGGIEGVSSLGFNLLQRVLTVEHTLPSLTPVEQALAAIGMRATRIDGLSARETAGA